MTSEHLTFMGHALELARVAAQHDDVPVGCVIVQDGQVIATGENRREADGDPTAHAEIVALRRAAEVLGTWRLDQATLYVTLEPCVMCAGAIINARIRCLVFGASDEKAGAVGSRYNVLSDPRLLHEVDVVRDVAASECAALLTSFFQAKRP